MPLVKYAPFTDSEDFPAGVRIFQDTINRLLSDQTATRPWAPSVDIFETENELVLKADVPGVDLKDIDIQIENGTLTLKGRAQVRAGRKQQRLPPSGTELRLLLSLLHGSRHGRH